jgi:hypothetical protein
VQKLVFFLRHSKHDNAISSHESRCTCRHFACQPKGFTLPGPIFRTGIVFAGSPGTRSKQCDVYIPLTAWQLSLTSTIGALGISDRPRSAGMEKMSIPIQARWDRWGQTGLPANFRQRAPEIHVRLVSPPDRLSHPAIV